MLSERLAFIQNLQIGEVRLWCNDIRSPIRVAVVVGVRLKRLRKQHKKGWLSTKYDSQDVLTWSENSKEYRIDLLSLDDFPNRSVDGKHIDINALHIPRDTLSAVLRTTQMERDFIRQHHLMTKAQLLPAESIVFSDGTDLHDLYMYYSPTDTIKTEVVPQAESDFPTQMTYSQAKTILYAAEEAAKMTKEEWSIDIKDMLNSAYQTHQDDPTHDYVNDLYYDVDMEDCERYKRFLSERSALSKLSTAYKFTDDMAQDLKQLYTDLTSHQIHDLAVRSRSIIPASWVDYVE